MYEKICNNVEALYARMVKKSLLGRDHSAAFLLYRNVGSQFPIFNAAKFRRCELVKGREACDCFTNSNLFVKQSCHQVES